MDEMTDREINLAICRQIMPWPEWTDLDADYDGAYPMFADCGEDWIAVYEDGGDVTRWFSPSRSLDDAVTVEARIKGMGRGAEYICQLADILRFSASSMNLDEGFALTTASARARCEAALKAIEVRNGRRNKL